MRSSRTNGALGILVPAALVTGLAGLLGGTLGGRLVFLAHAVAGYAIVALLAPKARIVRGALRRPAPHPAARRVFLAMAVLTLGVLVSGVVWAYSGPVRIAGITLINWHAYAAVLLTALLVWHVASRRPVRVAAGGIDRAAFLRIAGAAGIGAALTAADRTVEAATGTDARRRFTGSHELGSHGGTFPSVSWLNDDPEPLDPAAWQLYVRGRVARPLQLGAADLAELPTTNREVTIDCTGGWFSHQQWTGVPLDHVLELAGADGGARRSASSASPATPAASRSTDAGGLLLATARRRAAARPRPRRAAAARRARPPRLRVGEVDRRARGRRHARRGGSRRCR